jgi:hypothetical protein
MRRWLAADPGTGQVHVVFGDSHDGVHERTEYRALDDDGRPVMASRVPEVIGLPVHHQWGPSGSLLYVLTGGALKSRRNITVESAPAATGRTACPRAENRRRKCVVCAADDAAAPWPPPAPTRTPS